MTFTLQCGLRSVKHDYTKSSVENPALSFDWQTYPVHISVIKQICCTFLQQVYAGMLEYRHFVTVHVLISSYFSHTKYHRGHSYHEISPNFSFVPNEQLQLK